jgi:ribulose-phosphate 3-epimerase
VLTPRPGARLAVSASIVSAQLLDLREELERMRSAGVDGVHVDIEDGRFVPALGLGTRAAGAAGEWGRLPVDAHLMVEDPERVLALLEGPRLSAVAVHLEATRYPRRVLRLVRESGRQAGLAVNPSTPLPDLTPLAPYLDYVIMLTTDPEHLDPPFLDARLGAVAEAVEQCAPLGVRVVVDGGVGPGNVAGVVAAGAHAVVVGRALFASADPPTVVAQLQGAAA